MCLYVYMACAGTNLTLHKLQQRHPAVLGAPVHALCVKCVSIYKTMTSISYIAIFNKYLNTGKFLTQNFMFY